MDASLLSNYHGDIGSHASQATIWPLPSRSMIVQMMADADAALLGRD
jgi:hypothetical protein